MRRMMHKTKATRTVTRGVRMMATRMTTGMTTRMRRRWKNKNKRLMNQNFSFQMNEGFRYV